MKSMKQPATEALAGAWRSLDPDTFATAEVGKPAPDFTLPDTEGQPWKLSDLRGEKAVALIWIFADWCPVCHGEFRDLIDKEGILRFLYHGTYWG
ncbi:MAG: redoxin domain-containing protein, partial [Kiritimatiellia bacterium]